MTQYSVLAINPNAHLFEIEIAIQNPDPMGQVVYLPNWIPGSYMIRDFSKHIQWIKADSNGQKIAIKKLDKSSWQCEPCTNSLVIKYQVYAWDLSVRGAHLDTTHGFFNGTSVFLAVKDQEAANCRIEIKKPEGETYINWKVATGLTAVNDTQEFDFGMYEAKDYDELIDCPVEMAEFTPISFNACGVIHHLILVGRFTADIERLKRDLTAICEHHINFFATPAPFKKYLFMTYVLGNGFGGLEHRNSTALHCSREDLPLLTDTPKKVKDTYQTFLDLCSHEYFHSWNIKRIKPEVFVPYDTRAESYTELLWAFEGITSYYDSLALVQSGCIGVDDYLKRLAKSLTSVARSQGRLIQTVTDSSFDAWTKFYKQDENAPNSVVSYYTKGAAVALCLDLLLRQLTDYSKSLQDVMQRLWQEFGQKGIGIKNDTIQIISKELVSENKQPQLDEFFKLALYSTEELPVAELLENVGVKLEYKPRKSRTDRGQFSNKTKGGQSQLRLKSIGIEFSTASKNLIVKNVYWDTPAERAGISAGDHLLALNGIKISSKTFDKTINELEVGQELDIIAFRRDELVSFSCRLQAAAEDTAYLSYLNDVKYQQARFKQWLGQDC